MYLLSLGLIQVVRCDKFQLLPVPDNVIAHLNRLAILSNVKDGVGDNQFDFYMGFAQTAISVESHTGSNSNLCAHDMDAPMPVTEHIVPSDEANVTNHSSVHIQLADDVASPPVT